MTDDGKLVREIWDEDANQLLLIEEELACVEQTQGSESLLAWTCPPPHQQLLVFYSICILVGSLCTFIGLVMVSSIMIVQVSIGSLIVTFLVYSILPMFHTLHGHVVRMNLISIILFNIALLVVFHATNHLPEVVCTTLGFFTYFCSLAMFSWMTGRQLENIHHSEAILYLITLVYTPSCSHVL